MHEVMDRTKSPEQFVDGDIISVDAKTPKDKKEIRGEMRHASMIRSGFENSRRERKTNASLP
jgi:hypothetical protein